MIQVYSLKCSEIAADADEEKLLTLLESKVDRYRLEKASRIRSRKQKIMSLAAGILLQKVVKDQAEETENAEITLQSLTLSELMEEMGKPVELRYQIGEKGKPSLEGYPFHFSLSHSGDYILCGVSDREIGIDIQCMDDRDVVKLAERFYPEAESKTVSEAKSPRDVFFRLWTRKEAYGKLTGEGAAKVLGLEMDQVEAEFIDLQAPNGYQACAACYVTDKDQPERKE